MSTSSSSSTKPIDQPCHNYVRPVNTQPIAVHSKHQYRSIFPPHSQSLPNESQLLFHELRDNQSQDSSSEDIGNQFQSETLKSLGPLAFVKYSDSELSDEDDPYYDFIRFNANLNDNYDELSELTCKLALAGGDDVEPEEDDYADKDYSTDADEYMDPDDLTGLGDLKDTDEDCPPTHKKPKFA